MLDIQENFFVDAKPEVAEPWRCCSCNLLVYNVEHRDGVTYPAPGAPTAYFESTDFPRLCQVCRELLAAVKENNYLARIQREKAEEVARMTKNN